MSEAGIPSYTRPTFSRSTSTSPQARPKLWPMAKKPGWCIHPTLGDDYAEYWNLPKEGGIIVSSVMPGNTADQAGLKRGDVIVNFDGTPLHSKQDREVIGFTNSCARPVLGRPCR